MNRDEALHLLFPNLELMTGLERLSVTAKGRIKGTLAGKRRSTSLGGSQEFADYRPYTSGDDVRRIDWNVYGRTGRAYLRQYWDEQELQVNLYVDVSASMAHFGGDDGNKLQYAIRLAACLGYTALCGDDRVAIQLFSEQNVEEKLTPIQGRAASMKLFSFLADAMMSRMHVQPLAAKRASVPEVEPAISANELSVSAMKQSGTESSASIAAQLKTTPGVSSSDLSIPLLKPAVLPRRSGSVWIFTDALFESGIRETLAGLIATRQQVVLVHLLSEEELNPSLTGELNLVDSELGTGKQVAMSARLIEQYRKELAAYLEELKRICAELGIDYRFIPTDQPIQQAVTALLMSH